MGTIDPTIQDKINQWLSPEYDSETVAAVRALIDQDAQTELIDSFYKDLEFGTGGLRGIMGVGSNRINKYSLGKATQGLANYLKSIYKDTPIKVAIAYDSRNNSQNFGRLVADVFSANDIQVYLFDELRPTPLLSFAIRHFGCQSGVMLTASHNPKEYNGYKAYWNDGCQITAPHDTNIIDEVNKIHSVSAIKFTANPANIIAVGDEIDLLYMEANQALSLHPEAVEAQKDLKIVYSPIHGTGITLVPAMLKAWGFTNVHIVQEQATPDGNFPTVIYPNPEEEDAMAMATQKGAALDADLVLATDPDADRVGVAVKNTEGNFQLLNGNQIGALLTHYVLESKKQADSLRPTDYIVKTIVTTELIRQIANNYQVRSYETLTGFKFIGEQITKIGDQGKYLVGGEESYGFLVGDLVRDKDAANSCAFLAEMTAFYKTQGKSLFDVLLALFQKYGFYQEKLVSLTKKGKAGAEEIKEMMVRLRQNPPLTLAGISVTEIKDYQNQVATNLKTGEKIAIDLPVSDVLQFITVDGDVISARPSGTEPKIKFYCSVKEPLPSIADYKEVAEKLDQKVNQIMQDII